MPKRLIYLVCLGLLLGLVGSVQTTDAAVVAASMFNHATLGEENWTEVIGQGCMTVDTVNQEMDFYKFGSDPAKQGQWDLSGVKSYMGDGDVWTISFDVRNDSRTDPLINEIIMAIGQGICYEEPGPGDAPDRMVKLLFDEDDPGFWRLVTTSQGDDDEALTEQLAFDVWYHIDIVFNKSGSTLNDYMGSEDLSDNNADFWINGVLGIWEYDLLGRGMVEEDPISTLALRSDKNQKGWGSFDNFEIRDGAYVFLEQSVESLVADNMETYTVWGVADNNIFEIWVDDYGRGATLGDGSVVSLEETIAADGNSMRFDFNDTVVSLGYLSKATAEVANLPIFAEIGKDWMSAGVKALTLSFRGVQGNGLEPMWVELGDTNGNSTRVTYGDHPGEDTNDVNDEAWHEWNIDLQDFNTGGTPVNLSSVNDITIGFGDGALGGGGPPPQVFPDVPDPYTVYFDDIRLYPARCVLEKRDPCFARVDYVGDECVVDDRELDVMFGDWLEYDETFDAEPIGDTNLMAHYEFELDVTDSSAQGNHGTEIGGPLAFSAGRIDDWAIDLDGSDDCVDCGYDASLSMRDKITVACWVKSGGFGLNWAPFVSYRGEKDRGWQLRRKSSSNNACFTVRGTSSDDDPQGNTNVQDGEWHHIAGTYDGVSRYLYVDGLVEPRGSIADDTGLIGNFNNNDEVAIGAKTQNNERGKGNFEAFINALIDDVRIYNIALTQGQIITCMGLPEVYVELTSPANVYDKEPKDSKEVNFRDYAVLAERWLEKDYFPPE